MYSFIKFFIKLKPRLKQRANTIIKYEKIIDVSKQRIKTIVIRSNIISIIKLNFLIKR